MPLRHTFSNASMASSIDSVNPAQTSPTGPHSGPSHTTWRRNRLLRIGSSNITPQTPADTDETAYLRQSNTTGSYGTLPTRRHGSTTPSKKYSQTFRARHGLPPLPGLNLDHVSASQPASPTIDSPISFRGISSSYFRYNAQRPISAYDAPALVDQASSEDDLHARTNGIRVWYSSFSSIDWIHDAIKDSVRFSRLRRGKSIRSKVRLLVDKSMGWIIVTLVGFLTAIIAFLVVRGEQWLFDFKEGYCRTGWTKAKRFCCPADEVDGVHNILPFVTSRMSESCRDWRTWAEVFGASMPGGRMEYQAEVVQYVSYTFVAVSNNCLLCVHIA